MLHTTCAYVMKSALPLKALNHCHVHNKLCTVHHKTTSGAYTSPPIMVPNSPQNNNNNKNKTHHQDKTK